MRTLQLVLLAVFTALSAHAAAPEPEKPARKPPAAAEDAGRPVSRPFYRTMEVIGNSPVRPVRDQPDNEVRKAYDKAKAGLAQAKTETDRFYALVDAAKEAFNTGSIEEADIYARELAGIMGKYKGNWNYGNAVHDSNMVLGRLALLAGKRDQAKEFLLKAGDTPGSPQLGSFGPNMSLARDLLEKGERDAVLRYFDKCRVFWKLERGRLDRWSKDVLEGRVPEFGGNLRY